MGAGCSEEANAPAPEEVVAALLHDEAAAREAEAADRTLTIAVRRLPETLDPLGDLDPWARRLVDDLLFEGLVRRGGEAYPFVEPALADRCVQVPEDAPRDVYCHLRADASFHDGSKVLPEDVEYSLSFWLDPRRNAMRARAGLSELKRVELVDAPYGTGGAHGRDPGRWVRFAFASAEPLALERIADLKIVPRKAHRGHRTSFARAPVGSGPMELVEFAADRIVLQRTSEAGAGNLARVVVRLIPDGAAALTALRRGEVQILAEVATTHIPTELTKPGMAPRFDAWRLSPPRFDLVIYNLGRGVTAGPRMRSALDAALPRHAVSLERGMPSLPAIAPLDLEEPTPIDLGALAEAGVSARWGTASLPVPTAPETDQMGQATGAAILESLGWALERSVRRSAAGPLRLVLMWDGAPGTASKTAAAIRDAWRDIGVTVPYATASWAYLFGLMQKGEYDVALARLALPEDADLHPYFHSRGPLNVSGVRDAQLDAALEAFRAAPDRTARRAAERRVAERLHALTVTSVVYSPTAVMLVSHRVEGLQFVDDLPRLDRIELAPEAGWIAGA